MKIWFAAGSILSLILCLLSPVLYFLGRLPEGGFKRALLLASLGWFCLATAWASHRRKNGGEEQPNSGGAAPDPTPEG